MPPKIDIAGFTPSYGTDGHTVYRALEGDLGSECLYVDARTGSAKVSRLYKVGPLKDFFPAPAEDTEKAPEFFVVGDQDRTEMMVTSLAFDMLEKQSVVSVEDLPKEVLVEGKDGSLRLTDDLVVLSTHRYQDAVLDALILAVS